MLSPDVEWVWVRDHTRNLVYEGYIQAFSDTTPLREILLSEVKVYSNESSELLYKIPILYLGRNPNELTIEIPPISREEGGQHNAEGNN